MTLAGCSSAQATMVSKQLWALLAGLLKNSAGAMVKFRNVPRHSGFRAWQVMASGINAEKAEIRGDLLSRVTNPRAASSVADTEKVLKYWETTKRVFTEANGVLPNDETMRLAFLTYPCICRRKRIRHCPN